MIRAGVLTVSDRSHRGERPDEGGPAVRAALARVPALDVLQAIVPDDATRIADTLRAWAKEVDLVLTTGGTGPGPRDVTPEATRAVIDRELPGVAEAMRMRSLEKTPFAMGSRAVAGVVGRTLVINLPGSPRGAVECFEAILPAVAHLVAVIKGEDPHGGAKRSRGERGGVAGEARAKDVATPFEAAPLPSTDDFEAPTREGAPDL